MGNGVTKEKAKKHPDGGGGREEDSCAPWGAMKKGLW